MPLNGWVRKRRVKVGSWGLVGSLALALALACATRALKKREVSPFPNLNALPGAPVAPATSNLAEFSDVTIDEGRFGQTVEGLGLFGARQVWWSNPPYFDERSLQRMAELGVSMYRTQIYWDAEQENDNDDPAVASMSHFDFSPTSMIGRQFPWLRAIHARGTARVIGTVWSPPIWMKKDSDNQLASFCRGQCGGKLREQYYEEFAEYVLVVVRTILEETGVELYAVSIQNEPLFNNKFESCVYDSAQYARLLEVVVRRFRNEGLKTFFFGPEHMGSHSWNERAGFFDQLLEPGQTKLHAYAVHTYLDGISQQTGTPEGWVQLREKVHGAGVKLWMTETSGKIDGYEDAFKQAKELALALKYGQVEAWVYWYMTDDVFGPFGTESMAGPIFDLFWHYMAFITTGDVQVASEAHDPSLIPIVFVKPNKSMVSVIFNEGSDRDIGFKSPQGQRFVPKVVHSTSAAARRKVEGTTEGKVHLAGNSVTTVVLLPPNSPSP